MADSTFWDDPDKANKIAQDVNSLKSEVDEFHKLGADLDDAMVLQEMAAEEHDESLAEELDAMLVNIRETLEHLELGMLLSGEYDANNALMTLHAGEGGTEAQDWTEMLLRMFTRFAEQSGYQVNVLDILQGNDAGIKSASLQILLCWQGINNYHN